MLIFWTCIDSFKKISSLPGSKKIDYPLLRFGVKGYA